MAIGTVLVLPLLFAVGMALIDTADGVRNTRSAAVVKLPVSAIATNVRSTSLSSRGKGWRSMSVMAIAFKKIELEDDIIAFD